MSKRILFLANHFITLYSFRKELIDELLNNGHQVYLSLPKDDDNEYFEKKGCKIIETNIERRGMNPIKDLKLVLFYSKIMKQINPDIIFSYTIKPNIYGCLASNGKYRQVCNITGTGATFLEENIISKIVKVLYRLSITKAYKVFFQNEGDKDFFIRNRLVFNNYDMLPGSGCNTSEHTLVKMPKDDIVNFIYIGRVMKVKGIDEYLEAAKTIKEKYKNVLFYIAGWNEENEYMEKVNSFQEKGYVEYIGFRKDINEWINKSHCIVLASHGGEGIPNVLLEASATGRCCIASNINGNKDVIIDGKNGYLFNNKDAKDLIKKIETFLSLNYEEKAKMGIEGRKIVEEKFDRKIVISKYLKEVESI